MSAQEKIQDTSTREQHFSADVSRLLDIVANALYTNHDVFLRELISNAADACDRLRYDSLQNADLIKGDPQFRICIYKDTTSRTVTVVDNGVGMDNTELAENLGTIAKSGTATLMKKFESSGEKDKLKLIGQFGVGFYAGFMVAHKITVTSRKAGQDKVWTWESDGRTGFTVREASDIEAARLDGLRGTAITLAIKDEACEFLIDEKIKSTIKEYSDHIGIPIYIGAPDLVRADSNAESVNSTSALWMRSNTEVSVDEYTDFYRHIVHGIDEPIITSHWRAEGKVEFSALLFIPTLRPWDLFDPSRRHFVKLYIRRVFITDDIDTLMYPWLRFVRGIIDSEDLPLNISRESLQYNTVIEKIKNAVARRVLSDIDKISRNDPPAFTTFWGQFGAVVKEGLYDAPEHRDAILKICRFYSTHDNGDKFASLEDYVGRMKEGQDKIYYISGESVATIKNSPQLEGFRARGLEVLFFTDTIDDFWLQNVLDYKGKQFQSITKGDIDLSRFGNTNPESKQSAAKEDDEKDSFDADHLLERMQQILEGKVHNVRKSQRLLDSPVCLVAPDSGIDMHMERVLKVHQKYHGESKPVLEINPSHPLIIKLGKELKSGVKDISDAVYLLFDQARIIQGEPVEDPAAFARRMSAFIQKGM